MALTGLMHGSVTVSLEILPFFTATAVKESCGEQVCRVTWTFRDAVMSGDDGLRS